MSDKPGKVDENSDEHDSIARLLKLAGQPAEIPRGAELRTYERVRQEWRASTKQPSSERTYKKVQRAWKRDRRLEWLIRLALPVGGVAAAVLAIIALTQPVPLPAVAVATVSKISIPAAATSRYSHNMTVYAGETLRTGEGEGLGLLLARSESLRIDQNTELVVVAKDRFTLVSGRIYVDTGLFVYRDGGLMIETPFGLVTDVGTQFSVSSNHEALDVAVREGWVDISDETNSFAVVVGERVSLRHNMEPSMSEIVAHDEYWNWATGLAPEFDVENGSLYDFLTWVARETGRELVFENDEQRMAAMRLDIHGQISNLSPDDALRAIMPTTNLRYRIEDDKIVIEQ